MKRLLVNILTLVMLFALAVPAAAAEGATFYETLGYSSAE